MKKLQMSSNSLRWFGDHGTFREHGPCEIENNGTVLFSQLGSRYYSRRNGPSIIDSSGYVRYTDAYGNKNRLDGPAVIYATGKKEYWVNHQRISPSEFFLKYGVL